MKRTVLALGILAMATKAHATPPDAVTFQGVLRNNMGQLQSMMLGTVTVTFYNAQSGGSQVGSSVSFSNVPVQNGLFTLTVNGIGYSTWVPTTTQVWMELNIGGIGVFPRQQVTASMFAVEATLADSLKSSYIVPIANGGTGSSTQNFVDLTTNQNVIADKTFIGTTAAVNNNAGGTAFQAFANSSGAVAVFAQSANGLAGDFQGTVLVNGSTIVGTLIAGANNTPAGGEPINSFGPNSGISMDDRAAPGSANRWVIYSSSNLLRFWEAQNGDQYTFTAGGGGASKVGGGSWASLSDERLKNVAGAFTRGLKELMRLEPIRYRYRPGNAMHASADAEHIGFGAQSVQRVIPEAVLENSEGYLMVDNDPILWTMLNAIKEQQGILAEQARFIDSLRADNAALSQRLNRIEQSIRREGKPL